MAEFREVMSQFKRLCDSTNQDCSSCGLGNMSCSIKDIVDNSVEFEKRIMSWAVEHPEPVYPTWKEWLEEQRVVVHFDSVNEKGKTVKWELTNKSNCPIPADIAEKLGIEPKNG